MTIPSINHNNLAYDNENGVYGNTYVGKPHLLRLFEKLGTEKDDVTMAKKVSVHTHLNVKNQDRQR